MIIRHDGGVAGPALESSRPVHLMSYAEALPGREAAVREGGRHLRNAVKESWTPDRVPLFKFVALETRTGCNLSCSFCPVGRGRDPREPAEMSLETIRLVARQLGELEFVGTLLLFCNNEPLLDDRLTDIVALCRAETPRARIKVLTNGTKLTLALVHKLFHAGLSLLEIDNYTDSGKLIRPVRVLVDAADDLAGYDIRINMRRVNEVLTNRAGTAPNAVALSQPLKRFCALPFTDLNIVPGGRVTLCCFDAHEKTDFGNVNESTITDIWTSEPFQRVRSSLLRADRSATSLCAVCDYDGFRTPTPHQWLTKSNGA